MFGKSKSFLGMLILIAVILLFSPYVYASESFNGQKEERRLITISQGIELVLKNSRMIKVAIPDNAMAFQDSLLARSALLPQLNAYINKTFNKNAPGMVLDSSSVETGNKDPLTYGFDVYQTLFDFGKNLSNLKASRELYKATQAHTESVKRLATLEFIISYFNLLEAEKMILVFEKEVESLNAYLNDIEQLYEHGSAVENDLLPAKVRLADTKQKLITARNNKEISIARLNNILALPLREKTRVQDIVMDIPQFPDMDNAWDAAITLRPEITFYTDQIKASIFSEKAKAVENYPVVFADAGYSYQQNKYVTHEYNSSIGLGMKVDLYDGGASRAQLFKERAQQQKLTEQKGKLTEDIKFEIEDSFYGLKNACEKVQVAKGALEQADENVRFYRIKYNAGGATTTDVLEAITLQTKAQANYCVDDYEMKRNYAKLMYSMGVDLSLIYEKMESKNDQYK
ncbi:MAG: TolC family protein [Candidatus Omnitrophica bacterium]|nr:TolC family protein [Candidatus Omnitrophota bacterium]